jgi:Flp pilus assembly protein TadD
MARRRGDGRSDRQQDERPEVGQSEDTGVPGGGKPASEASDDPASATGRAAPDPDPDPIPPASEGGERLARARELVREGRIEEAIALYREIVTDHPESLKARNNLGLLYDGLGHHERALEQFEAARALDPENVEVLSNVGSALIGMGRFDEAERELRRGMKLEPDNVEVRAHLGILYFRRGLYAQADTELRWVCGRDEEHGPAHFYRGEALNRMGKVDMAIEVMERAARIQPMNPRIYQTLGILYDRKHMPAEAAQMYRKVRELSR